MAIEKQDPVQDFRDPVAGEITPSDPIYYEQEAGRKIPFGWTDTLGAVVEETFDQSPLGAQLRNKIRDEQNAKSKALSPEELNRLYPEAETPFTGSMSVEAADFIVSNQQRRKQLERIISQGPESSAFGVVKFGAAAITSFVDPYNVAATVATGGLFKAYGVLQGTGLGMTVARNLTENLAGNVLTEAPVVEANVAEGMKDPWTRSALNVAVGTVGGTAFTMGASYAYRGAKTYFGKYFKAAPQAVENAEKAAISQMLDDKRVNVEPVIRDSAAEVSGKVNPDSGRVSTYRYQGMDTTAPVNTVMYAASPSNAGEFKVGQTTVIEADYGQGIYLTDNPLVANGYAARKAAEQEGKVFSVDLKEVKLLDLNKPLPPEVKAALAPLLEQADSVAKETLDGATGKEILDVIADFSDEAMGAVDAALKEAGYDGIRYEGGKFMGMEGEPHNVVKLFDSETPKARAKAEFEADRSMVGGLDPKEIQAETAKTYAPENDASFEPNAADDLLEFVERPQGEDSMDLSPEDQAVVESVDELRKIEALDDVDKGLIETVDKQAAKDSQMEQVVKAAIYCVAQEL